MAFYSSNARFQNVPTSNHTRDTEPSFDIITWFPHYQSCVRHFLDHSQHSYPCQALAAFLNIMLPYQRFPSPVHSAAASITVGPVSQDRPPNWLSLIPYVRRLVVTGFDDPAVLRVWFGENWRQGVSPLHEQEKRNLLFAAKSGGWASVKKDYDMFPDQMVPFLKPLEKLEEEEIQSSERSWSNWLAMEDWMVGPRAP